MEKLHINLIKKYPRNYMRIFMGILMILVVTGYKVFVDNQNFSNTYLILFLIAGLYYTILGTGTNPLTIIAKAYISIDDEKIKVKKSSFSKVTEANWSDIKEVEINITNIRFKHKNNENIEFEYQHLDNELIHTLKTTIITTAKSKNITLT